MENKAIIALSGKGGVGKTSISAAIVKLLVEAYPDKRILAIDADPAVGLSTALGIEVKTTIDDIRKEIVENCDIFVDGRFELAKKNIRLKYCGSENQKVIDVKETLKNNKIILFA